MYSPPRRLSRFRDRRLLYFRHSVGGAIRDRLPVGERNRGAVRPGGGWSRYCGGLPRCHRRRSGPSIDDQVNEALYHARVAGRRRGRGGVRDLGDSVVPARRPLVRGRRRDGFDLGGC